MSHVTHNPRKGRKPGDPLVDDHREAIAAKRAYNSKCYSSYLREPKPKPRPRCPVCGQAVYSAGGIHPQCAVARAEGLVPE